MNGHNMKYTHTLFSLSFLLACSFMARAMEIESTSNEKESYHVMIQQIVAILKNNHVPTQKEYSLHQDQPGMGGPLVKKVILGRMNGKETDKALDFIRQFDWKNGIRADAHTVYDADKLKEINEFARYLALANDAAEVESQEVNDDGYLVTTFAQKVPFHTIGMLYFQVPGMGEVKTCT